VPAECPAKRRQSTFRETYAALMPKTDGFTYAGNVGEAGLNLIPPPPTTGRRRHPYGDGPFAKLVMPRLPNEPGLYLWDVDGSIVYVGQTRTPLPKRLGSNGYSNISAYNTLAHQPGRKNGGQQTNCRINSLANDALAGGKRIGIWYRVAAAETAREEEARWMSEYGAPEWNRRLERSR
jgi:hypothetical protein